MNIPKLTSIRARAGNIRVPSEFLGIYSRMTESTWRLSQESPSLFRYWAPYIRRHQRLTIDALNGLRDSKRLSLCIIGVENGFDIPWQYLTNIAEPRIKKIVLVDLDKGCMERRRDSLANALRKKVEIVQADASLAVCRAVNNVLGKDVISSAREALDEFLEQSSGQIDLLPFADQEFDLVLSTQVMNQLLVQPLEFIKRRYEHEGPLVDLIGGQDRLRRTEHTLQLGHIRELFRLSDVGGRVLISHIPSERCVARSRNKAFGQTVTVNGETFWATKEMHHSKKLGELISEVRRSIKMRDVQSKRWGWLQKPPEFDQKPGRFLTVEGVILEKI